MNERPSWLRRLTTDDALMGAALAILVFAFAAPGLRTRSFRALVVVASTEVQTLKAAAERHFAETASWPSPGARGAMPAEVSTAFPGDSVFVHDEYTIQWGVLEVVDRVEVPLDVSSLPGNAPALPQSVEPELISVVRPVGEIVVQSANDALLAELLARYGPEVSFVRDSTWTLIVGAGAN